MGLVFRLLSRLPLALLHALGALLGWIVYLASPTYRRRFQANATQAGIPWAEARPAIAAAGRMSAELPWLWVGTRRRPLGGACNGMAPSCWRRPWPRSVGWSC